MFKNRFLSLTCSLLFTSQVLSADTLDCYDNQIEENVCECVPFCPCRVGNIVALGPEYYYVDRVRDGGTKQTGNVFGLRANFDRIKPNSFYIGGQAYYGTGILKGTSRTGRAIRSRLTEGQIEGALGYTFCFGWLEKVTLTPFVGCGYFQEINKFTTPSPLLIKFNTTYGYVPFGLLTNYYLNSNFSIGLNARFRFPWDPEVKVSNDPEFADSTQKIGDRLTTRIELPIVYCFDCVCSGLEIGLMPFYENRRYGARENFPFDFSETSLNIWGVNFQAMYAF